MKECSLFFVIFSGLKALGRRFDGLGKVSSSRLTLLALQLKQALGGFVSTMLMPSLRVEWEDQFVVFSSRNSPPIPLSYINRGVACGGTKLTVVLVATNVERGGGFLSVLLVSSTTQAKSRWTISLDEELP